MAWSTAVPTRRVKFSLHRFLADRRLSALQRRCPKYVVLPLVAKFLHGDLHVIALARPRLTREVPQWFVQFVGYLAVRALGRISAMISRLVALPAKAGTREGCPYRIGGIVTGLFAIAAYAFGNVFCVVPSAVRGAAA